MTPTRTYGRRSRRPVAATSLGLVSVALSGCGIFAQPHPAPAGGSSLAPAGSVGYVVCSNAVTPVELATGTPEAPIPLPITGTPNLGDFAIATSSDGRWAYVVTADGAASRTGASSSASSTSSAPAGATTTTPASTTTTPTSTTTTVPPSTTGVQNVVIPIDLVTQRAAAPIDIPGQGATHAIVVLPGGHTVLAASGTTLVPVDVDTRQVGRPVDLGAGQTVYGLALDPVATTAYALVPGGVVPVNTDDGAVGPAIPTGLTVSSVYSPHGIAITSDGATVYVVGQGPPDFGGRVLPITTSTGATGTPASFDNYGIADPAALALEPAGSSLLVADAANNWINPVPLASFTAPPTPVRLPPQAVGEPSTGTQHPTDIVLDPSGADAFVVEGFDSVLPFDPGSETFGRAIPVCTGASSMAIAPAP